MGNADDIVIQSPTSFVGSARRIWRLTRVGPPPMKILTIPAAALLIAFAWVFCAAWLIVFGLVMLPWRLLRRGQRRRKQEARRHQEVLAATRASGNS